MFRLSTDRAHYYYFEAEYHPVLGYPTLVNLDLYERVVDDEMVIHVTRLEALESE